MVATLSGKAVPVYGKAFLTQGKPAEGTGWRRFSGNDPVISGWNCPVPVFWGEVACLSRSVFRCPFADDHSADGGAGMDMDDPVGPGWIQGHEHPFPVGFDQQLFEGGGMVVIEPDDDHAAVSGFAAGIDGYVIPVVERFVASGVVHAFSDDLENEGMLAVFEGTRYPFLGVTRREVVDGFRPVARLNPGDERKLSGPVRRRAGTGTGHSHRFFLQGGGRSGIHVEPDAVQGFLSVEIAYRDVESVCDGSQVFRCRIDFPTADAADGGLPDSGFFRQLHLGAQMGGLFHELVKPFGNDFLGFSFHKVCLSRYLKRASQTLHGLIKVLIWSIIAGIRFLQLLWSAAYPGLSDGFIKKPGKQ